jgi:hypothetical protein
MTREEMASTEQRTVPTEAQIDAVMRELRRRHPDRNGVEIERWTRAEFASHADDPVREFVHLLVIRAVEDRLRSTPPGVSYRPRG